MTKEDKQIIDRATKEEWRIGDRSHLKRLLKKNLEQYRENVELKNKIADIKANCDLALEGRDLKIEELEKRCAELFLQNNEFAERFAKSIEIIKGLLPCCRNYPQENAEKIKQAEQFLKEIEK